MVIIEDGTHFWTCSCGENKNILSKYLVLQQMYFDGASFDCKKCGVTYCINEELEAETLRSYRDRNPRHLTGVYKLHPNHADEDEEEGEEL